jgi:isoleucyl-tRNA synthetase
MMPYPKPQAALMDTALDEVMETVRQVVSLGRAARSRKNLKVRQPLSTLMVGLAKEQDFDRIREYLGIIQDELNVKNVSFAADLGGYVRYSAKLNFKLAGPKLGPHVKAAQAYLTSIDNDSIKKLVAEGQISFMSDGQPVVLTTEVVEIQRTEKEGFAVEADGRVTIALVTELTQELIDEGFAREMVNKIQNMRKSSGFEVTDHIRVSVSGTKPLQNAVARHKEFIKAETLARELEFIEGTAGGGTEWSINGEKAAIAVAKL